MDTLPRAGLPPYCRSQANPRAHGARPTDGLGFISAGGVFETPTGLVTLLFTDMVGSTALKQQLSDLAGDALFKKHHQLVSDTGTKCTYIAAFGRETLLADTVDTVDTRCNPLRPRNLSNCLNRPHRKKADPRRHRRHRRQGVPCGEPLYHAWR